MILTAAVAVAVAAAVQELYTEEEKNLSRNENARQRQSEIGVKVIAAVEMQDLTKQLSLRRFLEKLQPPQLADLPRSDDKDETINE